jgi:hypothetical protein
VILVPGQEVEKDSSFDRNAILIASSAQVVGLPEEFSS